MSRATLATIIPLAIVLIAPQARAQTTPTQTTPNQTTPDQAKALQDAVQTWVVTTFTDMTAAKITASLPQVILPDGDHFRLDVPAQKIDQNGVVAAIPPVLATIRSLAGGRWAIDSDQPVSPVHIALTGTKAALNGNLSLSIGQQENHIILDPSLATTSSLDGRMSDFKETVDTAIGTQTATALRGTWHNVMQPQDGGGVSLQAEATVEGYAGTQPAKDGSQVTNAIDKQHASLHAEHFDMPGLGKLLRGFTAFGMMRSGTAQSAPLTSAEKTLAHSMVNTAANLFTSLDGEESADGVNVQFGDHGGRIGRVAFGMGFSAPEGKADWHMKMSIDGIDSAEIPPGALRDYLPHHISLSPHVTGIPKATLVRLLQQAIDEPSAAPAAPPRGTRPGSRPQNGRRAVPGSDAMLAELLKDGPLVAGLDELTFDLGPAKLTATAEVDVAAADDISAESEIRVTGFDALIRKVRAVPELQQALPVLIFLKGIGEQDDEETVWNFKYEDGKMTVNDTDMSSLIPHDGPPAKK